MLRDMSYLNRTNHPFKYLECTDCVLCPHHLFYFENLHHSIYRKWVKPVMRIFLWKTYLLWINLSAMIHALDFLHLEGYHLWEDLSFLLQMKLLFLQNIASLKLDIVHNCKNNLLVQLAKYKNKCIGSQTLPQYVICLCIKFNAIHAHVSKRGMFQQTSATGYVSIH